MATVLNGDNATANDRSFPKFARNDCRNSSFEIMGRKDILPLLVRRIEQLPPKAKKILAMYYHEKMKLSEIATCFRLSEYEIDDILTQTVDLLNSYGLRLSGGELSPKYGYHSCPK
jgi:DNA-directed RNA polymerase specialized sigma subunit